MELPIDQLGRIIQGLNNAKYFSTKDLQISINEMINDKETTLTLTLQTKNLNKKEEIIFNQLLDKITNKS